MTLRRVTPDPYIVLNLGDGDLRVTPFSRTVLLIELHRDYAKKLEFRISLQDLQTLAIEGERLICEKLQQLDRDQYGVSLVLRSTVIQ